MSFGENSKRTLVCFPCRYTAKAFWPIAIRRCPTCRQPLRDCGKRFPVPPKDDLRGWRKAEAELNRIEQSNRDFFDDRKRRAGKIGRSVALKRRQ